MRHIDREATIFELAKGKRVLHLGCVGHEAVDEPDPHRRYERSLHARIQQVATSLVGVDSNVELIEEYAAAGLDTGMIVGNVERLEDLELGDPFDVIVSGNVIEHLSNPGGMLDGMRALSHSGTAVLVTTPHALGLRQYVKHIRGRFTESNDHMMTFNGPSLANLMTRHGFRVTHIDTGYAKAQNPSLKGRVAHRLINRYPRFGRSLLVQAELP